MVHSFVLLTKSTMEVVGVISVSSAIHGRATSPRRKNPALTTPMFPETDPERPSCSREIHRQVYLLGKRGSLSVSNVKLVRIIVASPSDVQAERDILPGILDELNRGIAAVEGYAWS